MKMFNTAHGLVLAAWLALCAPAYAYFCQPSGNVAAATITVTLPATLSNGAMTTLFDLSSYLKCEDTYPNSYRDVTSLTTLSTVNTALTSNGNTTQFYSGFNGSTATVSTGGTVSNQITVFDSYTYGGNLTSIPLQMKVMASNKKGGTIIHSGDLLATLYLTQTSNGNIGQTDVYNIVAANNVNVTPVCSLTSSASTTVTLPTVGVSAFKGVGSSAGSAAFNVTASCSVNSSLYVTFTDNTAPGNTSTTLSLASGSTASGVGIQLVNNSNGTAIAYGPDAATLGNTNQFLAGSGTTVTIPLLAKYIQTSATVTPGTVKGVATFTFAYQ